MEQFQYKVIEPNDDYTKAVIEKTGISSVSFTIEKLQERQNTWSQEKRQVDGQMTIEKAAYENIEHNHPWVTDLTEEEQYTVWMYYEARKTYNELKKQFDMRVKALDEYQTEKEHIMKVLGFEKTLTPIVDEK